MIYELKSAKNNERNSISKEFESYINDTIDTIYNLIEEEIELTDDSHVTMQISPDDCLLDEEDYDDPITPDEYFVILKEDLEWLRSVMYQQSDESILMALDELLCFYLDVRQQLPIFVSSVIMISVICTIFLKKLSLIAA